MKSERAKEFIIKYGVPTSPLPEIALVIPRETATALVEIAEEDFRKVAITQFARCCPHRCGRLCENSYRENGKTLDACMMDDCENILLDCYWLKKFAKAIDRPLQLHEMNSNAIKL